MSDEQLTVGSKLITTIVSTFTSFFNHLWSQHFPDTPLDLAMLPTFDGRAVLYPSVENVRDYYCWRQADCESARVPRKDAN
jgi:tRNA(His) guanylyltransferase